MDNVSNRNMNFLLTNILGHKILPPVDDEFFCFAKFEQILTKTTVGLHFQNSLRFKQ